MRIGFLCLAMLAASLSRGEVVLIQSGDKFTKVTVDPNTIRAHRWQYRLYPPDVPAVGGQYWGLVEEPTYKALQERLVALRKSQVTWWRWLGLPGRPEPVAFTTFNALGPIAITDPVSRNPGWGDLGIGGMREANARRSRLAAIRAARESIEGLFDSDTWTKTFESNPFRNQGLAVYQAQYVANAMVRLRNLEAEMMRAAPISYYAANRDLQELANVATHFEQVSSRLASQKPAGDAAKPIASASEAVGFLNEKLSSYVVASTDGVDPASQPKMSFTFTETGFGVLQAPPGWYAGKESVWYGAIDPSTVHFEAQFGGPARPAIVFAPLDNLKATYRGPNGVPLPLGTEARDAGRYVEAFRYLVRLASGVLVSMDTAKEEEDLAKLDPETRDLARRLRRLADRLHVVGGMRFTEDDIAATVPAPLQKAVSRRDGLWRDSEILPVLKKQLAAGAKFSIEGRPVDAASIAIRMGVPLSLSPIDPPNWRIISASRNGNSETILVRQACQAKATKGGSQIATVVRLVEETWSDVTGSPKIQAMRLVAAREVEAPAPMNADAIARAKYQNGDALLRQGRLSDAETNLRRAVVLQPDVASYWNYLGVAVLRQGRFDEAVRYCEQSVALNPKYALGLTNLADIRRAQGRADESLQLAQRAVAITPNDPWAHVVYGHACFAKTDFKSAEREYREAVRLEPGNGANYADLAGALLRQGRRDEAMEAARKGLDLGWRIHWVYKELAMVPK